MSKLLKWIVNIILLVAIVVAAGLLIPPFAGIDTIIVDDVDMDTNLPKGSVTYGVKKSLKELEVDDEVLLGAQDGEYIYRLKSINTETGSAKLVDEKSADGEEKEQVFREEVMKALFTVPFVGYVVMAMKSTEGLIIIGLSVIFVIVLFILAELWKRDDDEDEDEDDEGLFEEEDTSSPPQIQVDVPAQIMEEVSSEIASAVSSVMAEESGASEGGQLVKEEMPSLVNPDTEDLTEVVSDGSIGEELEMQEEIEEVIDEDTLENEQRPIELAMPVCSAEELLQKAKDAGDEPMIRVDDKTQVTILDYSDIL